MWFKGNLLGQLERSQLVMDIWELPTEEKSPCLDFQHDTFLFTLDLTKDDYMSPAMSAC